MNYKLLLGLILLSIVILPYIPALASPGELPKRITWRFEAYATTGILAVAAGTADIFFHGFRTTLIPSAALPNLTLIPQYSSYNDLVFNIAQNVLDADAPGETTIAYGVVVKGQYIPGLILVDPTDWVDPDYVEEMYYNVYLQNITDYTDLYWNPLAIREIRFSLNYLISRAYIATTIYGGSAVPKYCAVPSVHPNYPEIFKEVCETKYGFTAVGSVPTAKAMYDAAIAKVNATLNNYNMALKYDIGPEDKTWLYFVRPDGEQVLVVLNFLIRSEDERRDIGLYVASLIETNYNIWVNEIVKPRIPLIYTAYYMNPVERDAYESIPVGAEYEPRIWHIYTEGWVTTAELPWHLLRTYPYYFYLPYGGAGGPNDPGLGWIWYGNDTLFELSLNLALGVYVDEEELKNDMIMGMDYGIWESIRVFLVDEMSVFVANKYVLESYISGYVGLANPWAMRSLRFTKSEVTFLLFGTSFMSWFNPILGFRDVYTEYIHRWCADYDYWTHPVTVEYLPMRVESYEVVQTYPANISISQITGYVYDPIANKWTHISQANYNWLKDSYERLWGVPADKIVNGTYKLYSYTETKYKSPDGRTLGKWHDGSDVTVADILFLLAFYWEWGYNDARVTGEADPYYWPGIGYYGMTTLYGVKIIDYTTIGYWVNYGDVLPVYVADYADVWPDMPWHLLHAGEELVINTAYKHEPTGRNWGWSTRADLRRQAIDYITPFTTEDIRTALVNLKAGTALAPKVPPALNTYPDPVWVAILTQDVDLRYENAINFIDTYKHSYVSSGPYYIKSFDSRTLQVVIEKFEPYQFPTLFDVVYEEAPAFITIELSKELVKFKDKVFLELGDSFTAEIPIRIVIKYPAFKVLPIDPAKLEVVINIYGPKGEFLATLPSQYIKLPADYDPKTGYYIIKIEVPAAYLKTLVEGTETRWEAYIRYADALAPALYTFKVDLITRLSPPAAPEPTILPLIILAALVAIILFIKKK